MPRKKLIVRIDEAKTRLIKEQMGMDIEVALRGMCYKVIDSMYELAMLKKSGAKIDLDKLQEAGAKLGEEVVKRSRKDAQTAANTKND